MNLPPCLLCERAVDDRQAYTLLLVRVGGKHVNVPAHFGCFGDLIAERVVKQLEPLLEQVTGKGGGRGGGRRSEEIDVEDLVAAVISRLR